MGHINQSITVIKAGIIILLLSLVATTVAAEPSASIVKKYYNVDATSISALKRQMRQRGPKGYWAYTRWFVKWSGRCAVSTKINYTYPRHTSPQSMPSDVRKKWDAMIKALIRHEEQHGQFGLLAAKEISRSKCKHPHAVILRWAKEDRVLDKRTDHGKNEGVVLE
ncbi:DUF922 domain-containing protein [Profundibacter sp.]